MKKGKIPDVYVQDPKYFDKYKDDIKQMFGTGIEPIDMVAIHVRRAGNPSLLSEPKYSDNSFYVNLMNTDYYPTAMCEFPNEDFLIFSDDIEWCKKQSIFSGCEFSEGKSDVEDMNLMAGCKSYIIANSSFSWWAAYLGGGKTIAPSIQNWYTDGIERTKCPREWIRI